MTRRVTRGTIGLHLDDPTRVEVVGLPRESVPDPAATVAAPCEVHTPRPEEVRLTCPAEARGVAVLLDEKAPGWTAEVDGEPAPILLADGLFRAVPVPHGAREVVFRYRTPGLRLGAVVSLLAWAAWGLAIFRAGRPAIREVG